MPDHRPSVTAIIPTKNRADDLEAAVRTVLTQTTLPAQLIVVDQSATEQSERRIKGLLAERKPELHPSIDLVYLRDPGISGLTAARNRSLDLVRSEVVLFLDDDVLLEPDFVNQILEAYRHYPQASGVSGIVTNYSPPSRLFRYWSRLFARGPLHDDRQPIYWRAAKLGQGEPIRVTRLGGGLMSFRMSAIRGFRFDENLTGACEAEDIDFCMRLGGGAVLLIAPAARLVHKASPAGRTRDHWLQRHARAMWYLYRRNLDHGFVNRACFVWLNFGYGIAAALVSLHRLSLLPFAGLFKGVGESRTLARGGLALG
jgi:GT2 family glycosyltransferase